MKAKQLLLIALVVLISVSLLFGGSIHSSLHMDGHGLDGDGGCQVCELSLVSAVIELPALTGGMLVRRARGLAPPALILTQVFLHGSPRAPPA